MPRRWAETIEADQAACRAILREGSKSFAAASRLLPRRVREPATALYAFCRMADDAIDLASDPGAIDDLRRRIDLAYRGTPVDMPVDRAFARVAAEHDLPRPLVDALLEGFAWDAEARTYATISQLCAYAARVAGTVGAMMATLMMEEHRADVMARACDLGVAMQLTNIARDVGEDAQNGRLYLPRAWLEEAGVDPRALLEDPRPSPRLSAVIERLLGFADELYRRADQGIDMLPRDCQLGIRAARLIYADIGREIARAGFDTISRRAVVSSARKIRLLVSAFFARSGASRVPQAPPLPETLFLVTAASRR